MDFIIKNPWEIENIQIDIDNNEDLLYKFSIYDDSNLIQSQYFQIQTTDDFIGEIKQSDITTGIMVTNMKINQISIYLFILDNRIFIIKRINLPKFQGYFNNHLDSLIFMTSECKDYFFNAIFSKDQISEQHDQNLKEQNDINKSIQSEIIVSIIKKSQYRTIKMRQELLPNKYNSTKNDYKLDDFISIQSQDFLLYYNCKDQILNVLKFYDDEKRFNHEINFYHQIENTFPFIRKIFGIIKESNELPIIILEYVEGESLDKFILSEKEIDFNTKIKIIEEILFSVYYIHSNGFYLRDLKPNNILIDSKNDAILIDFDSSKEMYSSDEEEDKTSNIGNFVFAAPEQHHSKEYTYKVDSYSVGMIIHFIITRQEYNFNYDDLSKIYERKENISKNNKFPKLFQEFEFILSIYVKCFETSPILRPSIVDLVNNIIFDNNNNQIQNANEREIPYIINQLGKYEYIFKNANKFMYEKPIELSYLQLFSGLIYYSDKYISRDINKSIHYLTLSANQNNSHAQYYLGEIYYKGEYISQDINKSIHYLTLSANQNDSVAQCLLGLIYYKGEYISQDINKSIHYLTLSANQNDSVAQYILGVIYYLGEYISRDINKSIHYLTLSSNQNNSNAQCYLGFIYYKGKYISRDINKSIHYLTLSANQNHLRAQFLLGEIYYLNEYISRDIGKSIHYLTLSANQNDSDAQYYLGFIYYKGKYISRDINKSIHYLTLSSNQNNSYAQCCLGFIYYLIEYISRNINKSIHCFTLSANQNDSYTQSLLGLIYYLYEYISRDVNKSIDYLTHSSNQNNSKAQFLLGEIYYKGKYISRHIDKSIHYLTLSANHNNSYAQFLLGEIYYNGKYISRDINKSIQYLTLSTNQNDSYAQCLLGEIYYKGKYVLRDINKSIQYLTLSANQNNLYAQCLLGEIYYDGKYIERNIKKSIHYFKESSCFYNSIAKNYLGIIYKNGDGVERNIYFAKIYFKEAIKEKEERYSMYNLARIYYFGIEHERKISKAIALLEKASEKQLFIADLFLFYIFSNCEDQIFVNPKKSQEYKSKCQNNLSLQMQIINFNNLHKFIRNYDLIHIYDYSYDLLYFLLNGKFYDWKEHNDDNAEVRNRLLMKNINKDFYEGFDD